MRLTITALLLFFLSSIGRAEDLGEYRNRILSIELEANSKLLLNGYQRCVKSHKNDSGLGQNLQSYQRLLQESESPNLQAFERTLLLLELDRALYLEQNQSAPCQKILSSITRQQEAKERKTFADAYIFSQFFMLSGRESKLTHLIKEIDPWCALNVSPNFTYGIDNNPCFAGANIVLHRTFPKFDSSADDLLTQFESGYQSLIESAKSLPKKSTLDIQSKVGLPPEQIVNMLTIMASNSTSANGYISHYGKPMILETWKAGGTPMDAYKRYMRMKNMADRVLDLMTYVSEKSLKLQFLKTDVSRWNRHNWMAASLNLYYKERGQKDLADEMPILLGTLYESKDAISHIEEGVTLKGTIENFKTDTQRYRDGVKLAHKLW